MISCALVNCCSSVPATGWWIAILIASAIGLFLGAGVYGAIERAAPNRYRIGLRLPAGLQLFVAGDALELFVEAVPILEVYPDLAFKPRRGAGLRRLTVRLPATLAGAG